MRYLIVDDHPFIRKGLIHVLQNGMYDSELVIDEADSFDAAMEQIRAHEYEIVTVDISLSGKSGIHLLKQIKQEKPQLPVLIISTYGEDQYAIETLKLGAAGYMSKHTASEELMTAILQIRNSGKYISPKVALLLAEAITVHPSSPDAQHKPLSNRELEVARMLASGTQVKAIAFELGLSIKTVSTHRTRLLEKLGLNSNVALANYFSHDKLA
ncbi:MAG: response regulator transcription factor [Deltaproteobacteria bacterium]|jgi:DNA-binding NarL/FixJ family response regulator|nr:response regulator transcription factor [Deltaproteobacteria bacterium]